MGTRKVKGSNVVIKSGKTGKTDVWHRNSAGVTTKDGHRSIKHGTGTVSNHYGKTIHKGS